MNATRRKFPLKMILIGFIPITLLILYLLGVYWSIEPRLFELPKNKASTSTITGYTTVATTEKIIDVLLNKSGGFLSNDRLPPSFFLDNIPAWEFGVIVQVRDMLSVLRNEMSRSQSQSLENKDLQHAEPLLNISTKAWLLPAAESSYLEASKALARYRNDLVNKNKPNIQFYARADNLRAWFEIINKRLGGISQRLSSAIIQERLNTDLSNDTSAKQSTQSQRYLRVQTPWLEIDDVFYEARGICWALLHLLKASEIDFKQVLIKKNAVISLKQIIRELESTQQMVWSPLILNGSGFGIMVNHSLIMGNYISRANAALIDLRNLLSQG
jgi:hypothetical protein